MKRRDFLKSSAIAAAAVAVPSAGCKASPDPGAASVKQYRALGKTGLQMSDISFGCGSLSSSSLVLRAIDRGINYFDTAPDYGSSEKTIGKAMKRIQRDKIILTSKFCNPRAKRTHLPLGSVKADYIKAVEESLSRLKTDYLDICFVHSIGSQSKDFEEEKRRLLSEEMLSAAESLKKAGKIRFLAASSHGPNNMESLMMLAVTSGHFDVIMPVFNFMGSSDLSPVLRAAEEAVSKHLKKKKASVRNMELLTEAKKRGVGIVGMKTLAGAKDFSFESNGEPFQPAALKWVLQHPEISGLVITIKTVKHLDLYLQASGAKFAAADREVLDRYAARYGREYCRTGCGECGGSCPGGVEAATALRYKMYFGDYGDEKKAMLSYAGLAGNAAPCADCEAPVCEGACPYGLPMRALLRETHEALTFAA